MILALHRIFRLWPLATGSLLLLGAAPLRSQTGKVFAEKDGLVVVEGEDFVRQKKDDKRRWYVITAANQKPVLPDPDIAHHRDAAGGAYVECLPDTRVYGSDPLVYGENYSNTPGPAVIEYDIFFQTPGRYYVWVRCFATGSEDNGIHVGLDGQWPASGQRLQWCGSNGLWYWESKQRTEANHCGEAGKIYLDIETAGQHVIAFAMREDGFEMDRFLLTRDPAWTMSRYEQGPAASPLYSMAGGAWWESLEGADGWRHQASLGYFHTVFHPWLYHDRLHWIWDASSGVDNLYWWHPTLQWLWTSTPAMPFLYGFTNNRWYWLLRPTEGPSALYAQTPEGWELVPLN